MDGFLRVDACGNLPTSPSNSFLADEVASICPLITPSPPTNDLINPLPESEETKFDISKDLVNKLQKVQDDEKADSASSSSSALAEPACTQLLNHRNVYHHIAKDEETTIQETNGKVQQLQLTFRNPPDNYFFMTWNWPLIRKVSLWFFLSGLVAMVALVIAMISSLPRTCNPITEWYQGRVFYEIFPPSFYSENSQEGNFKGISQQVDYLQRLGIRAVRLNSIFKSNNYPEDFENNTSLMELAPSLGKKSDFLSMIKVLESRNISVVLDFPIYPLFKSLPKITKFNSNESFSNDLVQEPPNEIEHALSYWSSSNVQGFYLKGLENFLHDPLLHQSIRSWKKIIGPNRIFIVSHNFFKSVPKEYERIIWNNIDLVDVKLEMGEGVKSISQQIKNVQNSTLFTIRGMPWVQWSLGNVESKRLANVLPFSNATLGATLLQLMLPGSASIFYGDEIGLQQVNDLDNEIKHLHHLSHMPWPHKKQINMHSWLNSEKTSGYFDQVELISKMVEMRQESPSIYMNSVFKEGDNKANAEIKFAKDDFLVIQRWYPRRKSFVVASNFGSQERAVDLSTLLYSGEIVIGPRVGSKSSTISFKNIALWPGESVVIVLH